MTTQIKAFLVAATLMMPMASAVSAMTDAEMMKVGHTMLSTSLVSSIRQLQLDPDGVENLTLAEAAVISGHLNNSDSTQQKRQNIQLILDRAAAR